MTPVICSYQLCYLATPYSKWPTGIHNAYVKASVLAAKLLREKVNVYSPIAHAHSIAIYGNIDALDHAIWLPFDEAMMHVCEALLVAQLPGWTESKGVAHEIEFFETRKKPVHYLPEEFCA